MSMSGAPKMDFENTPICGNITLRDKDGINILTPKKKEKKIKEVITCTICLETISSKKNISKTDCGHSFCLTCLHEHLKINHTCPNCRKNILSKKPEKPLIKITRKEGIKMINRELLQYDPSYIVDNMRSFPDTARYRLKCLFQDFGLDLMKQVLAYQINGEETLMDFEDSDEENSEEEEDTEDDITIVFDRIGNGNRRIIESDDSDDDDDLPALEPAA